MRTAIDGYCKKSPQPREVAEQEAKEFIQVIEDSASYQFGYNHSVAYCLIGYLCAWLRYYYPGEFITTYLNHAKNDNDITGGTELADVYGIQISPPRFELSEAEYSYDKERNTIAKGLSSLKGYGKTVCNQLHEVGRKRYRYFTDSLRELSACSIKAAKIAPLIKIDYFASYGNTVELFRILNLFDFLKQGSAKSIAKGKIDGTPLEDMIHEYATDRNAKGAELKSYTITDMDGLLHAVEDMVLGLGLKDVSYKVKIENQLDILGYVELSTNKEEDRRKLLIIDCVPLKGKNGEIWAYAVFTRSIGSGKTARLTLRNKVFESKPIKKKDIIYANNLKKEKSGYWYLYDYDMVM